MTRPLFKLAGAALLATSLGATAASAAGLTPENAEALRGYYAQVNVGRFDLAGGFLSPDVVYHIPGERSGAGVTPGDPLPFGGDWRGQDQVTELFTKGFLGTFAITNMEETRTVATGDEVLSFNDEAFRVHATGRYYRVGVVHRIRFDHGRISEFWNYHDTSAARAAIAGHAAPAQPVLPAAPLAAETEIPEAAALTAVRALYAALQGGTIDTFVDSAFAAQAQLLAPGNPDELPFAGIWLGKAQIKDYFHRLAAYAGPVRGFGATGPRLIYGQGDVGVVATEERDVDVATAALVQFTKDGLIGRVSFYFDTHPLAHR